MLYRWVLLSFVALLAVASVPGKPDEPPVVKRMHDLMDRLESAGKSGSGRVAFEINQNELNDYLAYSLKTTPRPGLDKLTVKFFPNNYISSYSIIDFDAVERWRPGAIPALLRPVLTGKKPILVDLRFRVRSGKATYSVEKASFDGIPIPAMVVDKVIEIVAAEQPEKYDTTRPLPLPYGLKRVWTGNRTLNGET